MNFKPIKVKRLPGLEDFAVAEVVASGDTVDTPLIAQEVEKDFDIKDTLNETKEEASLLEDVNNTIEALESFKEVITASLESGGLSTDALKVIDASLSLIDRKHPGISINPHTALESYQSQGNYRATMEALGSIEVALEGFLSDIAQRIKNFFAKIALVFKEIIDSFKSNISILEEIDPKKLTGDGSIQFSKASWFKQNGKFDLEKTIAILENVLETNFYNGVWAKQLNITLQMIETASRNPESIAEPAQQKAFRDKLIAVYKETGDIGWKKTGKFGVGPQSKIEKPILEVKISDGNTISKLSQDPEYGLMPEGYKWIRQEAKTDVVKTASVDTYNRLLASLRAFEVGLNAAQTYIRGYDDQLSKIISNVELSMKDLSKSKSAGKVVLGLAGVVIGLTLCWTGIFNLGIAGIGITTGSRIVKGTAGFDVQPLGEEAAAGTKAGVLFSNFLNYVGGYIQIWGGAMAAAAGGQVVYQSTKEIFQDREKAIKFREKMSTIDPVVKTFGAELSNAFAGLLFDIEHEVLSEAGTLFTAATKYIVQSSKYAEED